MSRTSTQRPVVGLTLLTVIGLLTVSCASPDPLPVSNGGKAASVFSDAYDFDSLAEMIATADLSIQGTVLDMKEREPIIWDEDAADDPLILIDATVRVDEFLWSRGADSASGETITVTKEDGWGGDRLEVGQTGAFFLWESKDGTLSPIINSAVLRYGPDGTTTSVAIEEAWVEKLSGLDRSGFESKLDDAVAKAASGDVKPVESISAS